MVKHTQPVCREFPTNCLSVFDHSLGLALKGLTLASDRAVLNGNDVFSILWFQLKNGTLVFVFQKICFKVNELKTFEIFT